MRVRQDMEERRGRKRYSCFSTPSKNSSNSSKFKEELEKDKKADYHRAVEERRTQAEQKANARVQAEAERQAARRNAILESQEKARELNKSRAANVQRRI